MPESAAISYSHNAVWRIALPMIVSNLSVPLLGMVDTAVMGHLPSPHYLGAVAVGAVIFSFLFMGLNFVRMSTTGLAAQAWGANDGNEVRTVLGQAVLSALVLAAALLLMQRPLGQLALMLIDPSPDVASEAARYYFVRIWSAPATLVNFALIGWFIGMQNARAALLIMLATNVANIILDLWFVLGLGMTAEGVALASVIAEIIGVITGMLIVRSELTGKAGTWSANEIINIGRFRRLFSVNINIFIRTMTLMFAFGFLTAMGARQGDIVLAANAILLNLQSFMAYGLDGFANAAEALVGRAMGAKSRQGFVKAVRLSLAWTLGVSVVFSLGYLLAGRGIINLLTNIDAVRAAAYVYLPWMIVSPLVSGWSFLWDGVFIGGTRAKEMRDAMLISAFLVYLPVWYFTQGLGNHGLWLAFMAFMAARGLTMTWWFRRIDQRGGFVPAST
ncbi:MAG: MATE family efflux transporter [Gammaproteobacteria bacterium]|nr:MATE family efflux transporter [Gammaproteobacteria bacterium]